MNSGKSHKETQSIRTQTTRSEQREHATPIHMTSSFVFDSAEHARALFANEEDGNVYSRYSNPTCDEFIRKIVELEGCEDGISTSSGMAGVFVSMAGILEKGDHILVSRSLFGSTHQILTGIFPKWGITHTYVDIDRPQDWEAAITPETRMIFVETPSNPGLDIIDLEWLGELSRKHNLILNVDNCFATPILQNPADYGADLIVHSATKYIDGQGRAIGGVIAGKSRYIEELRFFARHSGPAMSPFNAWIFSKSLETLPVRIDKHCQNAAELTERLQSVEGIKHVKYPFHPDHPQHELARKQMKAGGGIVTITLDQGYEQASRFIDNLKMISISANLGDTRTIATHPASTTHSKLTEEERQKVGITPGLVRISVGLEHPDDIEQDIRQAVKLSKA